MPVVRVRSAREGRRGDRVAVDIRLIEGEAGDEVDAEEQRDAENQNEDRGGAPVRAEPAFPIVQDSTKLREAARMRERLYRHCGAFSEAAILPLEWSDKRRV